MKIKRNRDKHWQHQTNFAHASYIQITYLNCLLTCLIISYQDLWEHCFFSNSFCCKKSLQDVWVQMGFKTLELVMHVALQSSSTYATACCTSQQQMLSSAVSIIKQKEHLHHPGLYPSNQSDLSLISIVDSSRVATETAKSNSRTFQDFFRSFSRTFPALFTNFFTGLKI